MQENDAPQPGTGKLEGENHRAWPDLVLLGATPGAPTYAPIGEDHALYALAAWTYHHADELERRSRDGLLEALGRAWPRHGRRKSRHVRGAFVGFLLNLGVPEKTIADKWSLTPGEVTDLARDFRAPRELRHGIEVQEGGEPYDPATQHGRILSLPRDIAEQGNEDWRRVEELVQELGYTSIAELAKARRDQAS